MAPRNHRTHASGRCEGLSGESCGHAAGEQNSLSVLVEADRGGPLDNRGQLFAKIALDAGGRLG